jgi:hypothetical protein
MRAMWYRRMASVGRTRVVAVMFGRQIKFVRECNFVQGLHLQSLRFEIVVAGFMEGHFSLLPHCLTSQMTKHATGSAQNGRREV